MREWWAKLRALSSRRRIDEDLREEIEAHVEMEVEANRERGLTEEEARESALRSFGNRTLVHESSREAWAFPGVEALLQDVRYALRMLRRSSGFAFAAVSMIGLGIGATASAFMLLDHVLLRPLPFADSERLVFLYETQEENGVPRTQTSPPNYLDWRAMSRSFDSMGAYISVSFPVNLSGRGEPQRLDSAVVSSDVLETLGVAPFAGRSFTAEDDRVGSANVVLLGHALALALFGDPASAVGRSVRLDDEEHTILGVMPPGFAFPSRDVHLWRPLRFSPAMLSSRSNHILFAVARRKDGVSLEEARADMDVVGETLRRAYPKDNARSGIGVASLRDILSPQSRLLVLGVFGAAFCLLLIACTNLANLLFARAVSRRQEIAVRMALGAARERLLRQSLTESLVLAVLGGALGLFVAGFASPLLVPLVPNLLPVVATPDVGGRVAGFAALVTLLTTLGFGVGPALLACRRLDAQALRSRSRDGSRTARLRAALVLAEVAGTVMLLVGVGLLRKALFCVETVDPGFRTEGVVTVRTALPMPKYGDATGRRNFYERVLAGARELPGVASAAYVSYQPMEFASGRLPVTAPGVVDDPLLAPEAIIHFATPGYFETLGIPLRRGRDVRVGDDATAPFVAVISESLGERLWPGEDPIGRRLFVARAERTVVGVAADIAVRTLEGPTDAQIYFPAEQLGTTSTYYAPKDLVVRSSGDPLALAPALRRIVREADPAQAVTVRLLEDIVAGQTRPRRDQLRVLGSFAAVAFFLAAVGVHGLLSFTVSTRTRELGVRVALGAARGRILRTFVGHGVALGVAGIALGMPLAYVAARGMTALLFGVEPDDPAIYGSAAALAVAMTLAGSLRPALRAARVDPALTIRSE